MNAIVPIGPPKTKEEAWARLDANFFGQFKILMDTTDSDNFAWDDHRAWEWFLDWCSGPLMKRLLYDEAEGPKCLACVGDTEWDEFHEFSPRDKTGMPPCLCGHLLANHSKGEKGENNPMYRYFELFVRGKKPVPGMGPIAPLLDYDFLRLFWQVLMEFERFRGSATNFFGVVKKEPSNGVP